MKRRGLYTSLQQAMQVALYRVEPQRGHSGCYAADNLAQRYSVLFGAEGVKVQRRSDKRADPHLNLRLAAIEEDGHPVRFSSVRLRAKGERMEYDRGNVQEWYANTPKGLEQGFTIVHKAVARPQGKLQVRLALSSGWQGHLSQDGQWVDFPGSGLRYGKLQAQDARGRRLGSRLRLSGSEIALEVDTRQAEYPVRIDPLIVGPGTELTASDAAMRDFFGYSVSISGNIALVGSEGNANNTGAAYVFTSSGGTWTQQAELSASDGAQGDNFGSAVSVSGNTALVGAPGRVNSTGIAYVFSNNGGGWTQQQELKASDGAKQDVFGLSVSLSGNTALVGAPYRANFTGAAYVFSNTSGTWTQQQELTASDGVTDDGFGWSVSLSGNTALVGAPGHANFTGAVYVFSNTSGTWTQQQELTASDGVTDDELGYAVSVSGNTALVGAPDKANETGAAYVFTSSGGIWTQQAELSASDGGNFGQSVSVSGYTALVGAPEHVGTGAAYVFTSSGGTWTQQAELSASDGAQGDNFGNAVSLSGYTALVGAPNKANNTGAAYVYPLGPELNASDGATGDELGFAVSINGNTALVGAPYRANGTGTAYLFSNNGETWSQQAELSASDAAQHDTFGFAVSLSSNIALVGAPGKTGFTGAVYVFSNTNGTWTQQAELRASDGAQGDGFGQALSLSGDTALVGAPNKANDTGAAYIFVQSGNIWTQQQKLSASDGAPFNQFGQSLSLSGNTALVGAPYRANGTGAAYLFSNTNGTWTQQQELSASDGAAGDNFGFAVSLSGNTALVGAPNHASATGAVYVFVRSKGTWTPQQELSASDGVTDDELGYAVSLSGNTALVGALGRANSTGIAYVFVRSKGTWTPQQELSASDGAPGDFFGQAVSLSGDTALVGAYAKANYTGAAYVLGQSPATQNHTYVAYVNTPLSVANAEGVLSNDSDPSTLPLAALLAVPPANGSLTLNPDGSFLYTPDTGFSGTDTFAYQATDGYDISDLAWVTITVITPIPPVISDLDPTEGAAGANALFLLVNGIDFTTGSVVSVNNMPVSTTFVSDMQLLAVVPGTYLSAPTTLSVQVNNPPPDGASNSVSLPVVNFLDSVSTGTFVIGGSPTTLTIRLNTPAPLGGLTLALSSNQPGVAQLVDASNNPISQITFTTGQQTKTVTVQTTAVSQQTTVQLQASVGGTARSASLLVLPQQQTGVGVIHKPVVGPPLHSPGLPK